MVGIEAVLNVEDPQDISELRLRGPESTLERLVRIVVETSPEEGIVNDSAGSDTEDFEQGVSSAELRSAGCSLCSILRMCGEYSVDPLIDVLKHAKHVDLQCLAVELLATGQITRSMVLEYALPPEWAGTEVFQGSDKETPGTPFLERRRDALRFLLLDKQQPLLLRKCAGEWFRDLWRDKEGNVPEDIQAFLANVQK